MKLLMIKMLKQKCDGGFDKFNFLKSLIGEIINNFLANNHRSTEMFECDFSILRTLTY